MRSSTQSSATCPAVAAVSLSLFLAAAVALAAPPLEFRIPPSFAVGDGPIQIVCGDFNHDGIPDIATANFDDSTVGVLLGQGGATYGALRQYPALSHPDSIAVGDINGDGHRDLVTANGNGWNQPGSLTVLLGVGDGSFSPQPAVTVDRGPRGIVIADFNGDGKPDLATAISGGWFATNKVNIAWGNGDGTFGAVSNYTVGLDSEWLAVADFNGDGRTDIVVVNAAANSASVLLNSGGGNFAAAQNYAVGTYPGFVVTGDFNEDGKADFVVANRTSSFLSLYLGRGDGTFAAGANIAVGMASQIAAADCNNDGKLDLAALSDRVYVLSGNGNGTFAAPFGYDIGSASVALAAGNFIGDTNIDLAVGGWFGDMVSLLTGKGDGTFSGGTATVGVAGTIRNLQAADLNKDGQLDLVAAALDAGVVSVVLQETNGILKPAVNYPAGSQPYAVKCGDFNNDGFVDLAVATWDGEVFMLRGRTSAPGVFTNNWNNGFLGTFPIPGSHQDIAVGYFNAGTHLDIVVPNYYDASVSVALGDGTGQFHTPLAAPIPLNVGPVSVIVDDFNGDGKADIAVGYDSGAKISILTGRGDGTFNSKVDVDTWEIPYVIRSADVNCDGKPDLIACHADWQYVSVMLNTSSNGVVRFAPPVLHQMPNQSISVAVADFNGDNLPDIASGNFGSVSVLIGHGDGSFAPATNYFTTGNYVAAGDFNGDSMPDLALDLNGRVGVFWNDTLPRLQVEKVATGVKVAWPAWKPYQLQVSDGLQSTWSAMTTTPAVNTNQFVLTNSTAGAVQVYRLRRP